MTTRLFGCLFLGFVGPLGMGCEAQSLPSVPVPCDGAAATIESVGAFFGECGGPCQQTVTFDRGLQLTIEDWGESGVLAEQQGTLTEAGRLELATLQADLGCADLQETYGCPDCADGGGTRLVLGDSTHTWEYSSPPAELLDVDTWFLHLRDALRDCSSTEWVQVANDCEAFRWP